MEKHAKAATALGPVIQAYQSAVDDHDREAARILGVNRTDLRCLELLIERDGTSPTELADLLGLTSGSVTAMLDRLDRTGFLHRSSDPSDRRKSIVAITPNGRARCFELISPLVRDGAAMLSDHFDDDELHVVARFLIETTELQRTHVARLKELQP